MDTGLLFDIAWNWFAQLSLIGGKPQPKRLLSSQCKRARKSPFLWALSIYWAGSMTKARTYNMSIQFSRFKI